MKRTYGLALFFLIALVALAWYVKGAGVASDTGAATADGKAVFGTYCSACHGAGGAGGGPFPPLAGNPHVTGADTAALVATVLNGRSGPLEIGGQTYGGVMPAWKGTLSNAQIAAVLSYIRTSWGNSAPVVSVEQVAVASAPSAMSGAQIFAVKCAACHKAHGQGSETVPPLAGNAVVRDADPSKMVAIIVNGHSGPLTVNGKTYNGTMPTWKGALSDADIAAVATYVRSAWGNAASPVTEQQVAGAGSPVLATVGASIFTLNCARCHRANGKGSYTIPGLAGNPDVLAANPSGIIATVEQGRRLMPSWKGQLSPADIAAVLTYVRSAWGNSASAVSLEQVNAVK